MGPQITGTDNLSMSLGVSCQVQVVPITGKLMAMAELSEELKMNNKENNPLSGGLVYDALMPFCCNRGQTNNSDLAFDAEKNERLLHFLAVLDEHHSEPTDEAKEWSPDLIRLETKVDFLIAMVSRLSPPSDDLVPTQISLSAHGLSWRGKESDLPLIGAVIGLQIKPDEQLVEPLRFLAEVHQHSSANEEVDCIVRFIDQGESVTDLLGKLIFKHHRRAVAHLRSQQKQESN